MGFKNFKTFFRKILEYRQLHFNLIQTVWFNFKCFDFNVARRLPVYIYGGIQVEKIHRGSITLLDIRRGGVRIGGGLYNELIGYSRNRKTFISVEGRLILGTKVYIMQGAVISICENATVRIGKNVVMNFETVLHSKQRIVIGDNTRIGWKCQILDTDFHYMVKDGMIAYRNKDVVIDHNVWLASGVSVLKGTVLPAYTIVAQNSLVNKDYSQVGEHCLLGGIPARIIANNVERLLDKEEQLDAVFKDMDNVQEPLIYDSIKERLILK